MKLGLLGFASNTGVGMETMALLKALPITGWYVLTHSKGVNVDGQTFGFSKTIEQRKKQGKRIPKYMQFQVKDSSKVKRPALRYDLVNKAQVRGIDTEIAGYILPILSSFEKWVKKYDAVICIEGFRNNDLIKVCSKHKVIMFLLTNYEWFAATDPRMRLVDWIIVQNERARQVVSSYGYNNTICLDWGIHNDGYTPKRGTKQVRTFLHNAGRGGTFNRKATHEVVEAFKNIKEANLIIRSQLPLKDNVQGIKNIKAILSAVPNHQDLYKEGDVAIQPSLLEGLGLTLFESRAMGIPCITTDAPPMHEVVTDPKYLVKIGTTKTVVIRHKRLPLCYPSISDLRQKITNLVGQDISKDVTRVMKWAKARDWSIVGPQWVEAIEQRI